MNNFNLYIESNRKEKQKKHTLTRSLTHIWEQAEANTTKY